MLTNSIRLNMEVNEKRQIQVKYKKVVEDNKELERKVSSLEHSLESERESHRDGQNHTNKRYNEECKKNIKIERKNKELLEKIIVLESEIINLKRELKNKSLFRRFINFFKNDSFS